MPRVCLRGGLIGGAGGSKLLACAASSFWFFTSILLSIARCFSMSASRVRATSRPVPSPSLSASASATPSCRALSGGRGSIIGVFIGAMLMALLNNAFVLLGISAYWQVVTKGLIIILAVGIDGLHRGDEAED